MAVAHESACSYDPTAAISTSDHEPGSLEAEPFFDFVDDTGAESTAEPERAKFALYETIRRGLSAALGVDAAKLDLVTLGRIRSAPSVPDMQANHAAVLFIGKSEAAQRRDSNGIKV